MALQGEAFRLTLALLPCLPACFSPSLGSLEILEYRSRKAGVGMYGDGVGVYWRGL